MIHYKNFLLGAFGALIWATTALSDDKSPPKREHVVIQKNKSFSPAELAVNLGDTIVFKNEETDVIHNVYSITPGNEFEIHYQKPGTQTPIVIDARKHRLGKMVIECAIHPGMRIVVQIKEK